MKIVLVQSIYQMRGMWCKKVGKRSTPGVDLDRRTMTTTSKRSESIFTETPEVCLEHKKWDL